MYKLYKFSQYFNKSNGLNCFSQSHTVREYAAIAIRMLESIQCLYDIVIPLNLHMLVKLTPLLHEFNATNLMRLQHLSQMGCNKNIRVSFRFVCIDDQPAFWCDFLLVIISGISPFSSATHFFILLGTMDKLKWKNRLNFESIIILLPF